MNEKALSRARRIAIVAAVPWITYIGPSSGKQCEGYRWGRMPLKAVFGTKKQAPNKEAYRCKNNARYYYKALTKPNDPYAMVGTSGSYCWSHMVQQSHGMVEDNRWARYMAKYLPSIKAKHSDLWP